MSLAARTSPTGTAVTTNVLRSRGRPLDTRHAFLAQRLGDLPGLLPVEEHPGGTRRGGRAGTKHGVTFTFSVAENALEASAALADAAGAVVHEAEHCWSAVEPIRDLWPKTPGAHMRWHARTFGLLVVVEGRRAITVAEIEELQGKQGWSLDHEVEDGVTIVTLVHAESVREEV